MLRAIEHYRNRVKNKATTILLFTYGIVVGTTAPLLLDRCVTGGSSCGSCGGFCGVGLSVLPLVLFVTMRSRIKRASQYILSLFRKRGSR